MNHGNTPNINVLWAKLIVEELLRNGIDYFCLAPGSRSSPLAIAVGENPQLKSLIHYDERGLAFHAMGYTAATKQPSVIITTSGSAVANLFPAVIEASKKKLPLIILTADRPPELRQTGAMQTIDQVKIFNSYVRWQFDLPCPTQEIAPSFVLTTIDQAVHRAKGSPPGPVHINCMYREPPVSTGTEQSFSPYLKNLENWDKTNTPYTRYVPSQPILRQEQIKLIVSEIKKIKKGVIIVGKLADPQEEMLVIKLAQRLNWPVFPDISSGLRLGNQQKGVIHYYDTMLLSPRFIAKHKYDGVLHIGGRITSKRWYEYINTMKPAHYIMVLKHPLRNDPLHNVTLRLEADITVFCEAMLNVILTQRGSRERQRLAKISRLVDQAVTKFTSRQKGLNEPTVARLISEHIPEQTALFLANSMAVRYMDMFASPLSNPVTVQGNRGASGIDGTIATAAGFACGLNKPVTLLTGDLAFLHDLNSLRMLTDLKVPVIIVVLNNNGGGIFSFLPVAQVSPVIFEKYFATPHNLQFQLAAQMFGIHYAQPRTQNQFTAEYNMAFIRKKPTVIEVNTDRNANYKFCNNLQKRICSVIPQQ